MANPRQRRKSRSSSHKAVTQSRRAGKNLHKVKPIQGPRILRDAWDKTKTIRQNYAALGLAHSLTPHDSGGSERIVGCEPHVDDGSAKQAEAGPSSLNGSGGTTSEKRKGQDGDKPSIPKGYGRIVRDSTGAIVGVELGEEEEDVSGAIEGMVTLEDDERTMRDAACGADGAAGWLLGGSSQATGVVQALEDSSKEQTANKRTTSTGELEYLRALVEAHGEDVESMARDRRRNRQQYTAGQLGRALARAGRFAAVRKQTRA